MKPKIEDIESSVKLKTKDAKSYETEKEKDNIESYEM